MEFWDKFMPNKYEWVPENYDPDDDGTGESRPHTTSGDAVDPETGQDGKTIEPGSRVRMTSKGYEPAPEGLDTALPNPLGAGFEAPLG